MNHMMMSDGLHPAMAFHTLQMLCCLAIGVGILFLLFWAYKHLAPKQLWKWGWILVGIGLVICVVTAIAAHAMDVGMRKHVMMRFEKGAESGAVMMRNDVMMMRGMDHGGAMTMDGMTAALQGKTGDAFDQAFIEMMIPHHQGAVDMAELAKTNAKHAEIKAMADAIISSQSTEITQMQQWQKDWGYAN